MSTIPSRWPDRLRRLLAIVLLWSIAIGTAPAGPPVRQESAPSPTAADDVWPDRIRRSVAESEYHVTWQTQTALADLPAAWQAPNRAHGLRTYFTPEGIRVVPRTGEPPTWEWGLTLVGYGRAHDPVPVAPATLSASDNRVDYSRSDLLEWYVNDDKGLEQGFTLSTRPAGGTHDATADQPVVLVLRMHGTLRASLSADGQAIDLENPSVPLNVARYAGLHVTEAGGNDLPSWMELTEQFGVRELRLVFDDREAVYPVVVDPLLQAEAWSTEGNQTNAEFGFAVAGAGDVDGDGYDDVLVGAPKFDAGQGDEGRAFLYRGSASGVASYPAWTAEANQDGAAFGHAVAGAGDVNGDGYDDVIVGAPLYDSVQTDAGRAWVYHGSSSGPDSTAAWTYAIDQGNESFGESVAWAGDVNGDGYDDVIVGAPAYDNGQQNEGGVWVFHGSSPNGLDTDFAWHWETGQSLSRLGLVSTAGNVNGDCCDDVIVGAPLYNDGQADEGGVWVFHGSSPDGLETNFAWFWDTDAPNSELGRVSGAGDVNGDGYDDVIVGAPLWDSPATNEGGVWVFHGSEDGLSQLTIDWHWEPDDVQTAHAGQSVASAGDVNGDGFADVVVGALGYAKVFLGSSGVGLAADPAWSVQRNAQDPGRSVASAGDVNGDGFDDVIVGGSLFTGDKTGEGRAVVYHGAVDATASDLAAAALEREGFVCDGGDNDQEFCEKDGDCPNGACATELPAGMITFTGVKVWNDAADPTATTDVFNNTPTDDGASPAVYYGSTANSVIVSTGLAQDEGRGDTDWGADGKPDLVRWRFSIDPPCQEEPCVVKTFRFTTQFLTSDILDGQSRDTVRLYSWRTTAEPMQSIRLDGVAGLGVRETNPPVAHGIRVDDMALGSGKLTLIFEVADGVDGATDSALVVSNMYFSTVPLPEGADTISGQPPEYMSNPSPADTSQIAGTYTYDETLYSVPGIGEPFELSIRYDSGSTAEPGSLGRKWTHSYEATLQKARVHDDPDGDETPNAVDLVIVRLGSGRSEYFQCAEALAPCPEDPMQDCATCTAGDSYEPKYAGMYSTLTQTAAGDGTASYTYETKDHIKFTYDEDLDYDDGDMTDPYETYALTSIEDANGNAITLTYTADEEKRIDWITDTRGTVFTFNYADGLLTSVENPQGGGSAVTFQYETAVVDGNLEELLVSHTDLNGLATSFTYDQRANILTVTDDDGTTRVTNEYEEFTTGAGNQAIGERVVVRRNANPGDPGLQFEFTGETVVRTDRVNGKLVERYDVKSRLHDSNAFLGTDAQGNPCTESDSDCWALSETRYEKICQGGTSHGEGCYTDTNCPQGSCGSTSNPERQEDPLGNVTTMTYDDRGNMIERIDAVGVVTEMQYDADDNLLYRAVRPLSQGATECLDPAPAECDDISGSPCFIEAFCYDLNHNQTHEYDSEGDPTVEHVLHFYDPQGLEIERRNRRGFSTLFEYDSRGYRTKITGPPADPGDPQPVTEHDYDEFGRRIWTEDPRDHVTTFEYDPGGRLLGTTNALLQTTSYSYDVRDRMVSMTHPDLTLETWDYTPTGRLLRSTTMLGAVETPGECAGGGNDGDPCTGDTDCPEGHCAVVERFFYDLEDRLVAETDPLGRTTSYTCDAGDRLVEVIDTAGMMTKARYDANGNMLGFNDPEGRETRYVYDALNRVIEETVCPDGSCEMPNTVHTVTRSYDERDLVDTITRDRGDVVDYNYDKAGRLVDVQLTPSGKSIAHTLDANGNRTETDDTHFFGAGEVPIQRTFDALDRVKTRTDHFGNTIEYDYDLAGNLTSLCYDFDTTAQTCEPDSTVTYAYDELNRLTGVTDWDGRQTTYVYDTIGNLTSATLPDGAVIGYGYDAGQRLMSISGPHYQATLTRNGNGSITTADETLPLEPLLPSSAHDLDYDAANRLLTRDADGYSHDGDGNMISGTIGGISLGLDYDELNRLVGIDIDGDMVYDDTFRYDAEGVRVETTRGGTTTRYVFDTEGDRPRLLEERDDAGNLIARYVHGLGLIGRESAPAGTGDYRVYHYDLRGSTVALTDPDGGAAVTDRYAYDPYGRVAGQEGSTPNPFTYNGRDGVFDDDNGLYFMRTRYYAPELMRFIQKDQVETGTLADPQTLNRYAYAGGDPVRFVDPDGTSRASVGLAVAGLLVATAGFGVALLGVALLFIPGAQGLGFVVTVLGLYLAVIGLTLAYASFEVALAEHREFKEHCGDQSLEDCVNDDPPANPPGAPTNENQEELQERERNGLQTELDAPRTARPEPRRRGAPPSSTGAELPARPAPCAPGGES